MNAQQKMDRPVKGRKNGLYAGVSDELDASMRSGWADTERHGLEPSEQSGYAAKRRKALSAAFPGERLIIPAGRLKPRSNDTDYSFRPSSDYAYLTGDQTENSVLVLEPLANGGHSAVLYLLPRSNRENGEFWLDGQGELWVGRRRSLAEAGAELAIETRDSRTAADEIAMSIADAPDVTTRILRTYDAQLEAALESADAARRQNPEQAAEHDQQLKVFMHGLRLVKDDWEVEQLRAAVAATVHGFEDVVRELAQAIATSERWIEGTFWRRARVEGNDVGYSSICAAGPHATTLHWVRNDGPVRPGELLLLDAGVETHTLYTADVTRTLPISGEFSGGSTTRSTTRRRRASRPSGPAPGSATSTRRRSRSWPNGWSSGACSKGRWSTCSSSACTVVSPCTAPATCWASTCTTALTRAARSTSTACWSPGWSKR